MKIKTDKKTALLLVEALDAFNGSLCTKLQNLVLCEMIREKINELQILAYDGRRTGRRRDQQFLSDIVRDELKTTKYLGTFKRVAELNQLTKDERALYDKHLSKLSKINQNGQNNSN